MARQNEMEEALADLNATDPVDTDVDTDETSDAMPEGLNVIVNEDYPEGWTRINVKGDKNFARFGYNFGTDLPSMVELFGEDKVFDAARQNMIVKLQQVTRPAVKKGLSPLAIRDMWKPGVKIAATPVDPETVAKQFLGNLSKEQLEAMYADLMAAK